MRADGATVTIVGRAAGNPTVATTGGQDRVTVRVVSSERRFDESSQQWVDGDEYGVNVVTWRSVAAGVLRTVRKGDPVVVIGRISTRRFERNGATEYFTDVKGDVVAFDLGRGKDRIRRADTESRPTSEDPRMAPAGPEVAAVAGGEVDLDDELDLENLGDEEPVPAGVR